MFRSIRGSLLAWYTLILLAVLAGFGAVLYAQVRRATFVEIDAELDAAGQALAARLRVAPGLGLGMGPGGGRFGMPGSGFPRRGPRGAAGIDEPFDAPNAAGDPADGANLVPPPPRAGGPFVAGGVPPLRPGTFDRPGRGFGRPGRDERLEVPESLRQRIGGDTEHGGAYFVAWGPGGVVIERSEEAPDVPYPGRPEAWRAEPGSSAFRTRGALREVVVTAGRDRQVLVGRGIDRERGRLRSLAWTLAVTGSGVLAVGLLGGWVLAGRVIRPIEVIGATAERISASNLAQRIAAGETRDELGRLARVLNAMFARLEAAFDRQARFTADASHELRTPLAIIQAHAELALARERPPEEYREALATCLDASRRMSTLVDDLMVLARADAGNLELKRTPIDLDQAVGRAVDLLEPLAEDRGISLEAVSGGVPVGLVGDARRIDQVIHNLVTNAILYNRPGGSVRVEARIDGPWAVLEVADTGVGIPEADLPHVFERFYRVDKARSRVHGGSGLGLAICQGIVEAHGGTISASSGLGVGTTLTVRLPAGTAPTEIGATADPARSALAPG